VYTILMLEVGDECKFYHNELLRSFVDSGTQARSNLLTFLVHHHNRANDNTYYQGDSTVWNVEVGIMGARAGPRVTVLEGVGNSIVGVVPGA